MVDIHHHLLPGVDDGAKDMATTIAMVEMAVADGTTHIVATPHANTLFSYDRAAHEALLQTVRESLPANLASRITLGLGCDFHLTLDNIQDACAHPARYSINGLGYLMVELPDHGIPPQTTDTYYQLRLAGMTPILTHPERNATLQRQPELLPAWLRGGLLLQITAGSLTGVFGKIAQKLAFEFLHNNWAHVIASDAHSIDRRHPRLREAYELVTDKYGEETAERLFITNPLAAFEGRTLGPQPGPRGLYEDDQPKSWWQKLLGR